MRSLSPELKIALADDTLSLAACVDLHSRFLRVVGGESRYRLRFTEWAPGITLGTIRYRGDIGFQRSALRTTATLETGDISLSGAIDPTETFEGPEFMLRNGNQETLLDAFRRGIFDGADVDIFLILATHPELGTIPILRGSVGTLDVELRGGFEIEIRTLAHQISAQVGDVYQAECRADFGDSLCNIEGGASITQSGLWAYDGVVSTDPLDGSGGEYYRFQATGVPSAPVINGFARDFTQNTWFRGGALMFTSGDNEGIVYGVKDGSHNQFVLARNTYYPIVRNDTFRVLTGCDKRLSTCRIKFQNASNFQGEPYMPGNDYISRIGNLDFD